ncbi:MAG: hypothetical protein ACKVOY_04005 [Burkholderiaceae bacterium]
MAKAPVKKNVTVKSTTHNFFKLPFEVFYSEHIAVTMMEFKSDIKVKKFDDIKIVHKEQGGSWGTSFLCSQNNGPELYCCIKNYHDEVAPTWLNFLEEDNLELNSGCNYSVVVEGSEIKFVDLSDKQQDEESEEFIDIANMDHCCSWTFLVYGLGESCPDYLILDAEGTRIKVNLDGFVLDDDDNVSDERIFNPKELQLDESEEYVSQEMWEAKSEWVKSILAKDFPKQKDKLRLSVDTE